MQNILKIAPFLEIVSKGILRESLRTIFRLIHNNKTNLKQRIPGFPPLLQKYKEKL